MFIKNRILIFTNNNIGNRLGDLQQNCYNLVILLIFNLYTMTIAL